MRIGHGFDVHKFTTGDFVVLGGVKIPHSSALLAHSDGDVVLHALCDSLLGAAAMGDIGTYFPDTDEQYKNADSRLLLVEVVEKLNAKGLYVSNVDMTVIAQKPKLLPYIGDMRVNIAKDLGVAIDAVNVKATTTEGLGFEGREEGISAHAVSLIEHK